MNAGKSKEINELEHMLYVQNQILRTLHPTEFSLKTEMAWLEN